MTEPHRRKNVCATRALLDESRESVPGKESEADGRLWMLDLRLVLRAHEAEVPTREWLRTNTVYMLYSCPGKLPIGKVDTRSLHFVDNNSLLLLVASLLMVRYYTSINVFTFVLLPFFQLFNVGVIGVWSNPYTQVPVSRGTSHLQAKSPSEGQKTCGRGTGRLYLYTVSPRLLFLLAMAGERGGGPSGLLGGKLGMSFPFSFPSSVSSFARALSITHRDQPRADTKVSQWNI